MLQQTRYCAGDVAAERGGRGARVRRGRPPDTEAFLDAYDPDIEYDFSRSPLVGLIGDTVYRGHDGVRRWVRDRYEAWESIEDDCQELIDAGERVVVRDVDTRGRTLHGYAAVHGVESRDLGGFRERIAPGAFAGVMHAEVRCLLNHDPSQVLGRARSGTLRLADEQRGLRFECDLPDSPRRERPHRRPARRHRQLPVVARPVAPAATSRAGR